MSATWSEASGSVISIAQELIDKYHPTLCDLRIGFIFRSEAAISKGKTVLGGVSKIPDKLKVLLELDVLIWLAEDKYVQLMDKQKRALIDHQLHHISYAPGLDLLIVGHDIEEFQGIIQHYGFWNTDLFRSSKAFKEAYQLILDFNVESKCKVVAVQPETMQLPTKSADQDVQPLVF